MVGNLPSDAAAGSSVERDITVYAGDGSQKTLAITFTAGAAGSKQWSYSVDDGTGTPTTGLLQAGGDPVTGDTSPVVDGITLDLSKLSGYAGDTTVAMAGQNGNKAGTLLSVSLGSDGTLSGTFSNGDTIPLARVALASFTNPQGLEKTGNSELRATLNSGTATLGTAGSPGYGAVVAGALEASNVDLSQEFTNLIIAQRGFQANARIITTSDEILQQLTQLKQ
jgi:flagellar hook protein FlgE